MRKEIKISDFLDKEYKDYSLYVLEDRSIPSICDGLKPSQRKTIYAADKTVRKSSNKVSTLGGNVIAISKYPHGDSINDVIIGMTQEFKNNLSLFDGIGQFGSLKSPFASAPRYISVKLSNNFDLIYKDGDLLEHKEEEGYKIEPYFYLPIIPTILVNNGSGIAVGFATKILNREPKEVVKNCIAYLEGKKFAKIKPYVKNFNGTFENDPENNKRWYIKGSYEKVNTTTLKITELPPNMYFEKFEDHLNDLEKRQEIYSWENNTKDGVVNYTVRMERSYLSSLSDEKIFKLFKLINIEVENFTTLDENNRLRIFDSSEEVMKYFIEFRMKYYQKRKDTLLKKTKEEIIKTNNRALFVKAVIDGKIIINNKKKDDIVKQIEKVKIEMFNNSYDYLLSMPIYSLSKEKYEELLNEVKDKKILESTIKASIPKETYLNELRELLKKI